jgi:hypothetical protein
MQKAGKKVTGRVVRQRKPTGTTAGCSRKPNSNVKFEGTHPER